jgi:hypothetical protein
MVQSAVPYKHAFANVCLRCSLLSLQVVVML